MTHKLAFDQQDRGYRIRVWYREGEGNNGDALAEITAHGKLLRHFLYPAYKIWNLSAHFEDIVDSEIANNVDGYLVAGSDGLGGCVYPRPTGQGRRALEPKEGETGGRGVRADLGHAAEAAEA